MPNSLHYLNIFLGSGAILFQIFSVFALAVLFLGPKKNGKNIFLDFINEHFLSLGFFISFFSSLFSLVYSEIADFLPCYLCWYQRIFIFPLVFLFGMAMWEKDRRIIRYILPLAATGFVISVYQNFFYYFGQNSSLPCDASGAFCYQHLVSEFGGYISIPMLALSAFFVILTLLTVAHFYKKE